jgi:hypothetical protein
MSMLPQLVHLALPISLLRSFLETICWAAPSSPSPSSQASLYSQSGWNYDAWLLLAAWWTLCILFETCLRYLVPVGALAWWFFHRRHASQAHRHGHQLYTDKTVEAIVSDLSIIQSLTAPSLPSTLTFSPFSPFWELQNGTVSLRTQLRVLGWLYVIYLASTYAIGLRLLIALTGSLIITWKAPWAAKIRSVLWKNAYVRWGVYYAFSRLSGIPVKDLREVKSRPAALRTDTAASEAELFGADAVAGTVGTSKTENTYKFLFQVQENQRWWMGLDWTSALLPNERPSWSTVRSTRSSFGSFGATSTSQTASSGMKSPTQSDAPKAPASTSDNTKQPDSQYHHTDSLSGASGLGPYHPVTPPTHFTLPSPSTITLRDAKTGKRIRRTARWEWEESEWKVVVRTEAHGHFHQGAGGAGGGSGNDGDEHIRIERVEKPLPVDEEEGGSMWTKAAVKTATKLQEKEREKEHSRKESISSLGGHGDGEKHEEGKDGAGHAANGDDGDDDSYTLTDSDGWVYGDNKWENKTNKPGMGKVSFVSNVPRGQSLICSSIHATDAGHA